MTEGGQNRRLSEQEKQKISNFMQTKQRGGNNSNAKTIICLNNQKAFATIQQAADYCQACPENISISAKKDGFHASGLDPNTKEPLYWKFQNDYSESVQQQFDLNKKKLLKKKIPYLKTIQQIDKDTDLVINEFPNARQAAREILNDAIKGKGISRCASGQRETAYGYKWRYKEE